MICTLCGRKEKHSLCFSEILSAVAGGASVTKGHIPVLLGKDLISIESKVRL